MRNTLVIVAIAFAAAVVAKPVDAYITTMPDPVIKVAIKPTYITTIFRWMGLAFKPRA